jgi:hypothetical protein
VNNIWKIAINTLIVIGLFSGCSPAENPASPTNLPTKESLVSTAIPSEISKPSLTPEPTATIKPTIKPSPVIAPTKESVEMEKLIAKLFADKNISTTNGTYKRLDDFDESWAKLNWYQWWDTVYSPTNFVIQADFEWDTASNKANWSDSGCGIVYHTNGSQNHHATFLMMDGKVVSYRAIKDVWTSLKGGNAGRFNTPSDKAHIVLAVDKQWVTVYVKDKKLVRFQDTTLTGGKLALTVASGTNKDFGTRCQMKNIELWLLPES